MNNTLFSSLKVSVMCFADAPRQLQASLEVM